MFVYLLIACFFCFLLFTVPNCTEWPKNWHHFSVRLNFTNINRFSKLFHHQNQEKICNNTVNTKLMKRNIPVLLLNLIINLFSGCSMCIKWQNIYSEYFGIEFGVRQGSVLSPIVFAVYIDDICDCISLARGCSIVLYADDVLLISPSVVDL